MGRCLGVIFFGAILPKHRAILEFGTYSNIFFDDMGPQHVWPAYITCDALWLKELNNLTLEMRRSCL